MLSRTLPPRLSTGFVLAFCAVVVGGGAAACAIQRGEAVPVTADSIGQLHLDRPLAELRGQYSGAKDTLVDASGSPRPGVVFRFSDLTVVATQNGDTLDPSRPADRWTLTGCGGLLRDIVPVCANWRELTREFGNAGVGTSAGGPAVVRLCRLPGFEFQLDVGRGTVGSLESSPDLSTIPETARIERVTVWTEASSPCPDSAS